MMGLFFQNSWRFVGVWHWFGECGLRLRVESVQGWAQGFGRFRATVGLRIWHEVAE